jgi:hypothetical protein
MTLSDIISTMLHAVAIYVHFRTVMMRVFHWCVLVLCSRRVRDTQCGFKLFTRKVRYGASSFTSLYYTHLLATSYLRYRTLVSKGAICAEIAPLLSVTHTLLYVLYNKGSVVTGIQY